MRRKSHVCYSSNQFCFYSDKVSASKQYRKVNEFFEVELDHSGTDQTQQKELRVMETVVYLVCIAVASFAILAQLGELGACATVCTRLFSLRPCTRAWERG